MRTISMACCGALALLGCGGATSTTSASTTPVETSRPLAAAAPDDACRAHDAVGCWQIAYDLIHADRDDVAGIFAALSRACDEGSSDGCSELGRRHASGLGTAVDLDAALALYLRASHGEPRSRWGSYLAAQLLLERGASDQAAPLAQFACESEIWPACTVWGTITGDRDLLTETCERHGDALACERIGELNEDPIYDSIEMPAPGDAVDAPVVAAGGSAAVSIGGSVQVTAIGIRPSCVGYVASAPTAVVDVTTPVFVEARSSYDTTLMVLDPRGDWICNDDPPGGSFHARVRLETPGRYVVWAGLLDITPHEGRIEVHP